MSKNSISGWVENRKILQNVNANKNLGEKSKNMLPTKICLFYELSQTILFYGMRYLHLD